MGDKMNHYKSKSKTMISNDSVVTPFPGSPAANLSHHAKQPIHYGLQSGASELINEMALTMRATMEQCQPHALAAAAKASLRGYLCEPELLQPEHRIGDTTAYKRHLLYADPTKQFSILAIVWMPGQQTPIHGHTAWGALGIYSGTPYCEVFNTGSKQQPRMTLEPTMKLCMHPAEVNTVQPGIDDVHRIGNDSRTAAITIHIYGRDLLACPGSINITFN
jgi:predicted metal-dependent enzyme (double-stranded beta helix superfamily)